MLLGCCLGAFGDAEGFTLGDDDFGEFFKVVAFVDVIFLLSLYSKSLFTAAFFGILYFISFFAETALFSAAGWC
jgi:hypothetical protein